MGPANSFVKPAVPAIGSAAGHPLTPDRDGESRQSRDLSLREPMPVIISPRSAPPLRETSPSWGFSVQPPADIPLPSRMWTPPSFPPSFVQLQIPLGLPHEHPTGRDARHLRRQGRGRQHRPDLRRSPRPLPHPAHPRERFRTRLALASRSVQRTSVSYCSTVGLSGRGDAVLARRLMRERAPAGGGPRRLSAYHRRAAPRGEVRGAPGRSGSVCLASLDQCASG
jgi:hypothetical protein